MPNSIGSLVHIPFQGTYKRAVSNYGMACKHIDLQTPWMPLKTADAVNVEILEAEPLRAELTALDFAEEMRYYVCSYMFNSMVLELKLRKVGNSVGVVLPKEALAYLKVGEGDVLCVTESTEGSLNIRPAKADFNRHMLAAQDVVARYRNTLRELAK